MVRTICLSRVQKRQMLGNVETFLTGNTCVTAPCWHVCRFYRKLLRPRTSPNLTIIRKPTRYRANVVHLNTLLLQSIEVNSEFRK